MTEYRVVRVRNPFWFPMAIICAASVLIVAVALWPSQAQTPGYRAMCEAQGGLVVHTSDGRLCLWAGAVIPVGAP